MEIITTWLGNYHFSVIFTKFLLNSLNEINFSFIKKPTKGTLEQFFTLKDKTSGKLTSDKENETKWSTFYSIKLLSERTIINFLVNVSDICHTT